MTGYVSCVLPVLGLIGSVIISQWHNGEARRGLEEIIVEYRTGQESIWQIN